MNTNQNNNIMKRVFLLFGLLLTIAMQAPASSPVVSRQGNTYYYGEQPMNSAAYMQFLQNECPQALQQYKSGRQCMIAGWTLFGAGLVGGPLCFGYGMCAAFGASANPPSERNPRITAALVTCITVGTLSGAMFISSIPLLSVGYTRMHKSVKTYNSQCARQNVELTLGMTGNGVGMSVRF